MRRPPICFPNCLLLWCLAPALTCVTHGTDDSERVISQFERQALTDVYYSEGIAVGDINSDGHSDIIYGPHWYAGPEYKQRREIYPAVAQPRERYADHFFCWVEDFDGDGHPDILTAGFPGTPGKLYRNPGPEGWDQPWTVRPVADQVSNEAPQFADITGDGRRELICTHDGHYGWYVIPENPFEPWTFHSISPAVAPKPFGHGLGVGDLNNDGRPDLLVRDGWYEHPTDGPHSNEWPFHPHVFARAAADLFACDVDGDGDQDVITSLDAHNYGLAWYENTGSDDKGGFRFEQHLIMGDKPEDSDYGLVFTELHAVRLADMNGDGLLDIVTGKTFWSHHTQSPMWDAGAVVYCFELHRDEGVEPHYVPRLINDASGIGRQFVIEDLNGDGLPDVVTGGMVGASVLKHARSAVSDEEFYAAQPQRRKSMAEGLPPQAAAEQMTVPPGFDVRLAAGEPQVHQPIAMCWDARGRLWVAEAHTYPQRAPQGEGKDKILIFEDTTGDGVLNHSTVFIEGLNLVSGLEVGFGGVYVGAAPYLLFIPDQDGDDRPDAAAADWALPEGLQFPADVPAGATVLRDGFGWHDTHETLNAFIWGPDGWMYGCHGVFTHSRVGRPGTADGERQPLNAGVWRYHPVRDEFEVFMHGTSNPWGVDFNDYGQGFITACVIPHLWQVIEGGRYQRQGGQHFNPHTYEDIRTIADHAHYVGNIRDHAWWGHEPRAAGGTAEAGGGHAHCGAMIYLGDNWPQQYRNQIFFNNVHGNRVNQDLLEPVAGTSGYVGRHGRDLLMANDHYYRGINLRYGPDGTVYLIDWYDKNACHRTNPEIWDRSNGRIYRVSWGEPNSVSVDLSAESNTELIDRHESANEWFVRMSRKELMQRRVSSADINEVTRRSRDTARSVDRRLRYLWTLSALGAFTETDAHYCLLDRSPWIRSWGIQLVLDGREVSAAFVKKYLPRAAMDKSAIVRRYVASALQKLPVKDRWETSALLLSHGEDAEDPNIPLLIWYGVEPLVALDPDRAMTLAADSQIPKVRRFVVRRAASDRQLLNHVVDQLAATEEAELQSLILEEMLKAFEGQVNPTMPAAWADAYESLAGSEDAAVRETADQVAVLFGDQRVFPKLRAVVADAQADPGKRQQALNVLVRGQDTAAGSMLLKPAVLNDPVLQSQAVRALLSLGPPETADRLITSYEQFPETVRNDVISTLVSREAWGESLLRAIGDQRIARGDLLTYHVRQLQAFRSEQLNALLEQHWGTVGRASGSVEQAISEWKRKLSPAVMANARPGNGRRVYVKTCGNCHRLFGEGGQIGPELTGSNRANQDYLLENLLAPSSVVGRDYQMSTIVTKDGRIVNGIIKRETDSGITLQTINDQIVIALSDVEERIPSRASLMPEGQLTALSPDDARDLMAYLASAQQVTLTGPPSPVDPESGLVAGAQEGEAMSLLEKSAGTARNQPMGGFKKDRWSGNDHLWWTGARPGDSLSVGVEVPRTGRYRVEAAFTMARDYAVIRVSIGGKVLEPQLDCFNSPDVITTGMLSWDTVELSEGVVPFNIDILGANQEAVRGYMVGIDYVRLVPLDQRP